MLKNLFLSVGAICTFIAHSQIPCANGKAGNFPCSNYDLISHVPLSNMNASAANDSWGWTDPSNGNEYAIVCLNNGTAFIDISNPTDPIYLGKLPTATVNSGWRDVKVYKNHAFIVSEASNHGMQVFDLTRLRDTSRPPANFTADARYEEFGNAHNIVINENEGYAYVTGTARNDKFRGGATFINIKDPKNPKAAGGYANAGYSHDAQVITYKGPDTDHQGKDIYIGSNENEVVIVDVTDKTNPIGISKISYSDVHYTHQGWFTEDMRFFILGDELDEKNRGYKTRTLIFDFEDLDNPKFHTQYLAQNSAIDHNGYVVGDKFYLASYEAGIRVLDISDIANKNITEYGYFDTFPKSNAAEFNGVWNVYPFFKSGNILISDINTGLYVVKDPSVSPPLANPEFALKSNFRMYPNPSKGQLQFQTSETIPIQTITFYDLLGKQVHIEKLNASSSTIKIALNLAPGVYLVAINNQKNLQKLVIL